MTRSPSSQVTDKLAKVARAVSALDALFLFGSRARGDAHTGSDWDLGYLGAAALDELTLLHQMVGALGTDRVDLVNLERANGLLRFRVARDGQLIFEARPGVADRFRLEAARFWCDAAPILQRGYDDVLAALTP